MFDRRAIVEPERTFYLELRLHAQRCHYGQLSSDRVSLREA
jgi:hypothetical protein